MDVDQSASARPASPERPAEVERLAAESLSNSRLKILQDDTSGDYIYLLIDQDTGETVRRWPPEKHADLMEFLRTRSAGIVDQRA
ncbi:flagellar protein FlaG [Maricaulis sp.]|uniref:flagellar protein FlaG n=1 Tax=Maricaulis sp. TaxID=1486257 RepID=UPI000C35B3C8|nr:flagellar protein FlaG [Maricaulis sp.]MAC87743.1 hypothetical protein [Maricaulis sp.]